jgi:hypothetical protein
MHMHWAMFGIPPVISHMGFIACAEWMISKITALRRTEFMVRVPLFDPLNAYQALQCNKAVQVCYA